MTLVTSVADLLLEFVKCNFIVLDTDDTSARQSDLQCLDAEGW
jgi:hypothetical protein